MQTTHASFKERIRTVAFIFLALVCLYPAISSALGLIAGITFALFLGNPISGWTKRWTSPLLQAAVVGMGGAMNLLVVFRVGFQGMGYTFVGITLTLLLGVGLYKLLKVDSETGILVSVGTAICGGSAIAAVAPTINAKSESISVSLATVFLLNSIALILFPPLGHYFSMTETQFGLFSALAIHDTSSVVGAASQFGKESLQIATTVKLARALWIIPVTFLIGYFFSKREAGAIKAKKPWFILGFLAVAALVTWFPVLKPYGEGVAFAARRCLVLTLFLIGSSLSKAAIKQVGLKPLLLGITLWVIVGSLTFLSIQNGIIQ